jgi:hypothetical protein
VNWIYQDGNGTPVTFGGTQSGEAFSHQLPCIDTTITVQAVNARTSEVAERFFGASCIPQQETFVFEANRTISGTVSSDGTVTTAEAIDSFQVGDDAANQGNHANLHFDLSTLPDDLVSIQDAQVSVWISDVVNNPYTGLNSLNLVHVDYGATLDASDYRTTGMVDFLPGLSQIANDPTDVGTGLVNIDMTDAVQNAWENRETRGDKVQFILNFSQGTDNDNEAEYVLFTYERPGTLLTPQIEITFQNY